MIHIKQDLIKKNKVKTVKALHVTYNEKGEQQGVKDLEIFRYRANGNIYKYTSMNDRKDFIYNNNDLLVTTIFIGKNSRGIKIKNIINYNYDKDNNLLSIYKNGYLKKLYKSNTEERYNDDRLVSKIIYNGKLETAEHFYAEDGSIKESYNYKQSNNEIVQRETSSSVTEFFYSEDGKYLGFKTVDKNDGQILQEIHYQYGDNKVKISNPFNDNIRIIEYDENELPIKDSYYKNGLLECEHIIEYTYYN